MRYVVEWMDKKGESGCLRRRVREREVDNIYIWLRGSGKNVLWPDTIKALSDWARGG